MDTLFRNGTIWVKKGERADALAVRGQRILAAGREDHVRSFLNPPVEEIDLDGRMLMPGFHDGHLHLLIGGFSLLELSLEGITDRDTALEMIQTRAQKPESGSGSDDPWLFGIGYDENLVTLHKSDLDRLCPRIPAIIRTRDLHSALVNDVALKRAGITPDSPDPPGGKIERDNQGQPTGILREMAVELVESLAPMPNQHRSLQAIALAQEAAFRLGITSVSDSIREKNLTTYAEFHQSGKRKIRINGWRVVEDWQLNDLPSASTPDTGYQLLTLKGFVDGAMGSDTAWLLEDFQHRPGYRGISLVSEDELTHAVRQAMKLGYHFAIHAIGDRANRTLLNAYETAGITPEQRFRIEHAQLVATSDIPRFGQLGVVASMQPIHCTDDMSWKIRKIGIDRVKNAYPWRSLMRNGAHLVFGSDWPVASHNPLAGLRAAVTRKSADGTPKDGWNAAETVTLEEALDIYTRGGAYGAGWEDQIGTLEPGKYADMVVLSRNLFEINPLEFDNVTIIQSWVDGELVIET